MQVAMGDIYFERALCSELAQKFDFLEPWTTFFVAMNVI